MLAFRNHLRILMENGLLQFRHWKLRTESGCRDFAQEVASSVPAKDELVALRRIWLKCRRNGYSKAPVHIFHGHQSRRIPGDGVSTGGKLIVTDCKVKGNPGQHRFVRRECSGGGGNVGQGKKRSYRE